MNNLSTPGGHFAPPLAAPLLQETTSDEKEISLQLHQIRMTWIRRWILIEGSQQGFLFFFFYLQGLFHVIFTWLLFLIALCFVT